LASAVEVNGVKVATLRADSLDRGQLRTLVDNLKQKLGEGVVVLGSAQPEGKVAIIAGVTPGLTKRIQAGKLVGAVAKLVGRRLGRRQAGDCRSWIRRQRSGFGEKMVVDHTALGDKMKAVAGEIGVTPPSMTTPSDMALKAKLELLSGDAFDKAYISAMVKDHEEDLKDFQQEVADASSPAVKTAARQGETVIAHHLAMIRKIAEAHNVSAKNSGGNPGSHGL
jgi:hypothetical protein